MRMFIPAAFLLFASCAAVEPVLDVIGREPDSACVVYNAARAARVVLETKRFSAEVKLREARASGNADRVAKLTAEIERLDADIEAAWETEVAFRDACVESRR